LRTTIDLEKDVLAAVDRLRRERSLGLSEAVNELIRAGLQRPPPRRRYRQRSQRMGLRIDVANVAEAIEQLEGPTAR
jgi:hypothetical protein